MFLCTILDSYRPLSAQEGNRITVKAKAIQKGREPPGVRLPSYPDGEAMHLVLSCYIILDKLRVVGLVLPECDSTLVIAAEFPKLVDYLLWDKISDL